MTGRSRLLSEDQVLRIVRLRAHGLTLSQLAERFGVSTKCIFDAPKRETGRAGGTAAATVAGAEGIAP